LGKTNDFHLLNFENVHLWVKEEENPRFSLIEFGECTFLGKRRR